MDLALLIGGISFLIAMFSVYKTIELDSRTKTLEKLFKDIDIVERRVKKIRNDINGLMSEYGDIGRFSGRIDEIEEKLTKLDGVVAEIKSNSAGIENDIDRLDKLIDGFNESFSKVNEKIADLEGMEDKIVELIKRIETIEESITRIDTLIAQMRDENMRMDSEIRSISDKLSKVSFVVGSYQNFKDELTRKVDSINKEMSNTERRVKKIEAFTDYMRGIEKSVREMKAKFEAFDKSKSLMFDLLTESREELKKLSKMFDKIRAPVVYDIIKSFQSTMNDMEKRLFDMDYEMSLMRAKINELNSKYEELITPDRLEVIMYNEKLRDIEKKTKEIKDIVKKL